MLKIQQSNPEEENFMVTVINVTFHIPASKGAVQNLQKIQGCQ